MPNTVSAPYVTSASAVAAWSGPAAMGSWVALRRSRMEKKLMKLPYMPPQ